MKTIPLIGPDPRAVVEMGQPARTGRKPIGYLVGPRIRQVAGELDRLSEAERLHEELEGRCTVLSVLNCAARPWPLVDQAKKSGRGKFASLGPNFQMGKSTRVGDVLEVALRPI